MTSKGKIIIFEGPDGIGKTTISQKILEKFELNGVECKYISFPGREPGTLGHHVYQLHHEHDRFGIDDINPLSLQILHVSSHIDLFYRQIKPLVLSGKSVVMDRYWWSTWVYGLVAGIEARFLRAIIDVELLHWQEPPPDAIFLLTREQPYRVETDAHRWSKLQEEYAKLAAEQSVFHNLHSIQNDNVLEDTVDAIWGIIEKL